ncbi:MAG: hypothetical protein P5697_17420 [Limnospira sp. PMC 1256.20]|nr:MULTISPECIES: hypothetical protein [unclassified Limnospira]MDT9194709.1 hypothetical protein [Limnospira sp. PMC 1245.20]MDT9210082.1 hypothetical protein [Limnospira sp. PMC 1252.20]MDT9215248.1 hypothetical protein [Limnospira sp. PMC 1256.20]MDT9256096.1 hypothetical protein [Limnospira sp. PMC 1254.20]MDT9261132.1 hypothetical protein [Limnospira sp. PMC 1236.20]
MAGSHPSLAEGELYGLRTGAIATSANIGGYGGSKGGCRLGVGGWRSL